MRAKPGKDGIEIRRAGEETAEIVHRPYGSLVVVVLKDAAGAARRVGGDLVEEDLLEEARRLRVGVGALPVDFALEPRDGGGRQPDVAVANSAIAQIDVLPGDGERREIVELRRITKASEFDDIRSLLEP